MNPITKLNQLCLDIRSAVPGIKEHILAVHEGQATAKLGSKPSVILLGVIAAADRHGKPNQAVDTNATILYILEKAITGDAKELEQPKLPLKEYKQSFLSMH
ncbi:MAG: hypothetical protein H7Y07_09805 [Pyrinomonadaceae bacterium]|nr:hypothetical protein [Sphingobacteriaceae bacterium]